MAGANGDLLSKYRVKEVPSTVVYIPDFITKDEEDQLWNKVYSAPKPKWTCLSDRRLQNWGGLPHPKGMIKEPLPEWLQHYADKIGSFPIFGGNIPNHVLVNEYESGQGIMPHEDGPLFYPVVSTINLGSHTVLNFYRHIRDLEDNQQQVQEEAKDSSKYRHYMSLLLEPRSLLLLTDDLYKNFLHGIDTVTHDTVGDNVKNIHFCKAQLGETLARSTRVSLTIRYVPKVLKAKLLFGKKF